MEKEILKKLEKKLTAAVENCLKDKKEAAILYSGGLDSSLVAYLAYRRGVEIITFTTGTKDSPDILFINEIKNQLPFKIKTKIITKKELKQTIPLAKKMLTQTQIEPNLMQISLAIGLITVLKQIQKTNPDLALSGQGADELFAGYFRALKIPLNKLNTSCSEEISRLKSSDAVREKIIADYFKIKICYPYLDPNLVGFALKLPPTFKLRKEGNQMRRKYILRKLAEKLGLPQKIVNRPKKAWQYSSRIQREVRKIIRVIGITGKNIRVSDKQ